MWRFPHFHAPAAWTLGRVTQALPSLLVCSLLPFEPSHQPFFCPPSCHRFVSLSLEKQAVLLHECSKSGWRGLGASRSSDRCSCPWLGSWTRWSLKVPSNPDYSMISSTDAPLKVVITPWLVPGMFFPTPMRLVSGSWQQTESFLPLFPSLSLPSPAQRSGRCPLGKLFGLWFASFPREELAEPWMLFSPWWSWILAAEEGFKGSSQTWTGVADGCVCRCSVTGTQWEGAFPGELGEGSLGADVAVVAGAVLLLKNHAVMATAAFVRHLSCLYLAHKHFPTFLSYSSVLESWNPPMWTWFD